MVQVWPSDKEDLPNWVTEGGHGGILVASGPDSTIAVALKSTARLEHAVVKAEIAGVYEVKSDGEAIDDPEQWLDVAMENSDLRDFIGAVVEEAEGALLPYVREAISSVGHRTGEPVTPLAPSKEFQSHVEMDVEGSPEHSRDLGD